MHIYTILIALPQYFSLRKLENRIVSSFYNNFIGKKKTFLLLHAEFGKMIKCVCTYTQTSGNYEAIYIIMM